MLDTESRPGNGDMMMGYMYNQQLLSSSEDVDKDGNAVETLHHVDKSPASSPGELKIWIYFENNFYVFFLFSNISHILLNFFWMRRCPVESIPYSIIVSSKSKLYSIYYIENLFFYNI
jgi:hypothetical protein